MPDNATNRIQFVRPSQMQEQTKAQVASVDPSLILSPELFEGNVPKGNYNTWRRMRDNPTIALARAIANAPIITSEWSIEANDDVPNERVEFIQSVFRKIWSAIIRDTLLAQDYGFSAFEKIFEYDIKSGKIILP